MTSYLTVLVSTFFIGFSTTLIPGPIMFLIMELALKRKLWKIGWFLTGTYVIDLVAFLIILFGFGNFLRDQNILVGIGLVGGLVLMILGVQIFWTSFIRRSEDELHRASNDEYFSRPFLSGILVAGTNPLYWVWWSTVGVNFTARSMLEGYWAAWGMLVMLIISTGIGSIVMIYLIYQSASWLKTRTYSRMVRICSLGLISFGAYYIVTSIWTWIV